MATSETCERMIVAAVNEPKSDGHESQFHELVRLLWEHVPEDQREVCFREFMGKSSNEEV